MGLYRHTLYNLAGSVAPMAVSVATVPMYLHLVGATRYGVLALVWVFLGYFSLFDPGLSKAASYHIAKLHGAPAKEREDVFWTALFINLAFGLVGGIILYFAARPVFIFAFKMPESLRVEVLATLPWLAASIPVAIVSGVLAGVLQAREWFGIVNIINVIGLMLTQIIPLAIAYFHGPDLRWLIPASLLARLAAAMPSVAAVIFAVPLFAGGGFRPRLLRSLFTYGGWITLTNLLYPVLTTIDRLLIGSIINVEAVAFYTVPYNLVTRFSVIPAAVSNAIFPLLSRADNAESTLLARQAVLTLAAAMTPLIAAAIIVLPVFMKLWVGPGFAAQAVPVGMVLLFGVWLNGLSVIPYGLLQARNRPDLTAKFHALELLPFLGLLWAGAHYFGLIGVAWAWTLRVTSDSALLFFAVGHFNGWPKLLFCAAFVISAPFFAPRHIFSLQALFSCIFILAAVSWSCRISPHYRNVVTARLSWLVPTGAA